MRPPRRCRINIEAYDELAPRAMKHLRKGSYIQVTGQLKYDRWEDRETGKPRSNHKLNAVAIWTVANPPGARC